MDKWEKIAEILADGEENREIEIKKAKHGNAKKSVWNKRLWQQLLQIANDGKIRYGRLGTITGDTFSPNEIAELFDNTETKEYEGFRYFTRDGITLAHGNGKRLVIMNVSNEDKIKKVLEIEAE